MRHIKIDLSSKFFIRLRQNTLQLAAGMNGMATRRSSKSEGGLASANSALIPRPIVAGLFILLLMVPLSSPVFIANDAVAESEAAAVFKKYFSEIRDCTNYEEYERVTRRYAYSDMIKKMDSPEVKSLSREFKERLFSIVKNQFFDEKELVVVAEDIQGNQACIQYSRKGHSNLKGTATLIKENNIWKIKKVSEEVSSNR